MEESDQPVEVTVPQTEVDELLNDGNNNLEEGEVLDEILQEAVQEACGQKLPDKINKMVQSFTGSFTITKSMTDKLKQVLFPEGADYLKPLRINDAIYNLASSACKKDNTEFLKAESGLVKSVIVQANVISQLLELKAILPATQALSINELIRELAKSTEILGFSRYKLTEIRRESVVKCLNPEFKGMLTTTSPGDGKLFGADLADKLRELESTNKLTARLSARQGTGQARPSTSKESFLDRSQAPQARKRDSPAQYTRTYGGKRQKPTTSGNNRPRYVGGTFLHIDNWRKLTSNPFILDAVTGYEIEFSETPHDDSSLRHELVFEAVEKLAIDQEIIALLQKGAISRCEHSPGEFISHIFARPKKNSDKLRVILNLKKLNKFVKYNHFKMETLDCVLQLVMRNDWFVSIDLTDAYFSIPIANSSRKYLKFLWNNTLYQYNVLCFGLSSAPRVFTKCTKPIIAHFREQGFRLSIYIDDLILMHQSKEMLTLQCAQIIDMFDSLGFNINRAKSNLLPNHSIEHLGFIIDSTTLTVSLPSNKHTNIFNISWDRLTHPKTSIRKVAELIGTYVAYSTGTQWGGLFYRRLEQEKTYALTHHKGNFDAKMVISDKAKEDIRWWLGQERYIPRKFALPHPSLNIYSDASNIGWGAHDGNQSTGGQWDKVEASNHINWLELQASFLALQCFAKKLKHSTVLMHLDNTVAISYIVNQGGTVPLLNELARTIWCWCKDRDIWLIATYIEGSKNTIADSRSRIFHRPTEWSLANDAFQMIVQRFGLPEIDLFASRLNHKVPTYCSWEPDPDSYHVDAFTLNWGTFDHCYAFPPFSLVGQVINKMIHDNVLKLVLVCPKWTAQHWYPLLLSCLVNLDSVIEFDNSKHLLFLPFDEYVHHELWNKLNLCCFRLSSRH